MQNRGKITAGSYSRISTYEGCARKARYKFVDRIKEPSNAAMERGSTIHEVAAKYITDGGRLPKELKLFSEEFKALRAHKHVSVEQQWAFDKDWKKCEWDDWNFARMRIICDVVALVFLPQIVTFLAGLVIDRFDPDRQMPCRAS